MGNEFREAVNALLAQCLYIEDVRALKHFVFHARLNGCSNFCLLCDRAADVEAPDWAGGHAPDCPYPAALARMAGKETLKEYVDRK